MVQSTRWEGDNQSVGYHGQMDRHLKDGRALSEAAKSAETRWAALGGGKR